jgi:hypothetical protein
MKSTRPEYQFCETTRCSETKLWGSHVSTPQWIKFLRNYFIKRKMFTSLHLWHELQLYKILFYICETWCSGNCSLLILPWRLRNWQPTKHWYVCTVLHGVISQNTGGSVIHFFGWLYSLRSIQMCTFWCFYFPYLRQRSLSSMQTNSQ